MMALILALLLLGAVGVAPAMASGPADRAVAQDALTVPPQTLVDTARQWLLGRLQADPVETTLVPLSMPRGLTLPRGQLTLRVQHPGGPIQDGVVGLVVEATVVDQKGQRTVLYAPLSFQLQRLRQAVVAVRPLSRKRLIGPSDVRLERRPVSQLPRGALSDLKEAVGKEVVRDTGTGEALTAHTLQVPVVVRRGAPILLFLDGPGFRITARGVALEEGAIGQMIRVINQASRKEIHGRIEDDGSVRIPF